MSSKQTRSRNPFIFIPSINLKSSFAASSDDERCDQAKHMSYRADISSLVPDLAAIDLITANLAWEFLILPVSQSNDSVHVILPESDEMQAIIDKLQLVLDKRVSFDTADPSQLAEQIARHFPSSTLESRLTVDTDSPAQLPEIDLEADYRFLDLTGRVSHSTAASVCFDLGRKGNTLELSDRSRHEFVGERVFHVIGWLDAHYPCRGFHKLMIRCSLPRSYVNCKSMRALVACTVAALKLPANVSYEVFLESKERSTYLEHPQSKFY